MIDFRTVVAMFCLFNAFNLVLQLFEGAEGKWRSYSLRDFLLAMTLVAVALFFFVIMPKEN